MGAGALTQATGRRLCRAIASGAVGTLLLSAVGPVSSLTLASASAGSRPLHGVLDQTFGAGGRAFGVLPPALASSQFTALAREPDGKLLLKGLRLSGQPVIERRTPDGQLDQSFGEGGVATIGGTGPFHPQGGTAVKFDLQGNGGVVYAESEPSCVGQTTVKRLRGDGSADPSFGSGGATELPFTINGMAVDSQGRVLVVGNTGGGQCIKNVPPQEAKLARLLPDGGLDPSFGTDGIVSLEAPGGPLAAGISVALDEDGSIIVLAARSGESFLVALTPSSDSDSAFGSAGTLAVDPATASLLALPGGDLLTGNGEGCCDRSPSEIVLHRYLPDGRSDTSFGEGGGAHLDPLPGSQMEALAAGPGGTILLAGHAKSGGRCSGSTCEGTSFLARLTPAGGLDSSFGGTGWLALEVHSGKPSYPPRIPALSVAPSGEVYAAGNQGEGGNGLILAREADGAPGAGFGSGGLIEEVGTVRANTQGQKAVLEPNGETVVSAFTDSGARKERHVLIYFRPDGSLNTSRGSGSGFVDVRARPMIAPAGTGAIYAVRRAGIARIGPNGRGDPSFGHRGIAELPQGFRPRALLARGGKLLVAGAAGDRRMAVYQIDRRGEPNRGFGRNGLVILQGKGTDGTSAIIVDRRGRILLLGAGARHSSQLVRLLPEGQIDRSFASDGTRLGLPSRLLRDPQLATLPGGGVLIASDSPASGSIRGLRSSVLRLDARGRVVRSFGRAGSVHVPGFASPLAIFAFKRQLVLATAAPARGKGGLALRAYRDDGTVDRSFARKGVVRVGSSPTLHLGPFFAGRQKNGRIVVVGRATHRYGTAEPELLRFR